MSRILRSTDLRSALRSRQRGFLLNPYRFGGAVDYHALVLALGPRAYYKLDETSGSTANDASGNARHGTIGPRCQINQAPLLADSGKSYAFKGGANTGNALTIPSSVGDLNAFSSWTMLSWVTSTLVSGYENVFCADLAGSYYPAYQCTIETSGAIYIALRSSNVAAVAYSISVASTAVNNGSRHLLAFRRDASPATPRYSIWLDTTERASGSSAVAPFALAGGMNAVIGSSYNLGSNNTNSMSGKADGVAFFNSYVTDAQLLALYAAAP